MATPRTTLQRHPERGSHDRAVIDAILDEGLVAHVGFAQDGQTFVLPMSYARAGDRLYVHGAAASRALAALAGGAHACVTVTLLDGLVLARSAFRHSVNFRSVMVFGVAHAVGGDKSESVVHVIEPRSEGKRKETNRPGTVGVKPSPASVFTAPLCCWPLPRPGGMPLYVHRCVSDGSGRNDEYQTSETCKPTGSHINASQPSMEFGTA